MEGIVHTAQNLMGFILPLLIKRNRLPVLMACPGMHVSAAWSSRH